MYDRLYMILHQSAYKTIMQYLQRLVTQFCSVCEPQKQHLRIKRIHSYQEQSHNDLAVNRNSSNSNKDQHEQRRFVSVAQIIQHCNNLQQSEKPVLAQWIKYTGKKVLLLDLDKTLIYSTKNRLVFLRPYLNQFLTKLSQHYDIYLFTAATSQYVMYITLQMKAQNVPMDIIKGYLTRQNCIRIQTRSNRTVYIKDIRILTQCPKDQIVIVDDTSISYCLNPYNAVSISGYQGQEKDQGLLKVMDILMRIKDVGSVIDFISGNGNSKEVINKENKQKISSKQKQKQKVQDSDSDKLRLTGQERISKLTATTSCQSKS